MQKTSFRLKFLVAFLMLLAVAALRSPAETAPLATRLGREFNEISEMVGPAVVSITTVHLVEARALGPLEEFFERRLPEGFRFEAPEREFRRHGLGSGVIVSEEGYILTNNHVVAEAERLTVTLQDQRQFEAEVIGTDPPSELAVLKIDGDDLPTAVMGDSDALVPGEFVIAIGNPFGLTHTVTVGNVSATGRADMGIAEYEDFIQIDATINPGNSGGPLVNTEGQVVGVNTAIIGQAGGTHGIGFAVPSRMAQAVMREIIEESRVVRGWLGVSIQDLTPRLAEALSTERQQGALVGAILPDSPAAASELERGDLIFQVNDQEIADSRELRRYVAELPPGSQAMASAIQQEQVLLLVSFRGRTAYVTIPVDQ